MTLTDAFFDSGTFGYSLFDYPLEVYNIPDTITVIDTERNVVTISLSERNKVTTTSDEENSSSVSSSE